MGQDIRRDNKSIFESIMIINNYSLLDKTRLAWWLLRTKVINRNVRLFRFPITIRGREYIDFGHGLTTGIGCRFDVFSSKGGVIVKFGDKCQINDYVHIVGMEKIEIGNQVLMASHVFISDNSHGSYKGDLKDSDPMSPPIEREYITAPVKIGNNVWIGEGAFIMPGVSIGDGCVIGAHSIVNKSIPDYTIAAGAPACVIKKYNFTTKHWEKV